jgi:hypothetical protein
MNYTHKLARRLARLRPAVVPAACGRWTGDRKIGHNRAVEHHLARRTLPILTLVLLLAACADSSAPAAPDAGAVDMYQVGRGWARRLVGIRISPDTAVVSPGQTMAFKASGVLTDGSSRPITVSWAATGGTIDSAGLFTAGSTTGAYHVVGTEPTLGIADTAAVVDTTVSVDAPAPAVSSVSVSPSSATLTVGESVQLSAVAKDVNGTIVSGSTVSWSSSNPAVASVSSTGTVQALTGGTSTVTATIEGVDGKASITVQAPVGTAPGDCGSNSYGRLVSVSTAAQLSSAITNVQPGDLIELAPGTYTGKWTITRSGTATNRITLCGPRTATLSYGSLSSGWIVNLSANYWTVQGFSITNGIAGLHITGGSYNIIDGLEVHDVGQEAIALKTFSRHNIVRNNSIHDTGRYMPGFGEGVYIGTADGHWCSDPVLNCDPDTSDSNQVVNNVFGPNVRSENLDAKPGTTGGLLQGNTFNCVGESTDNSNSACVTIKGNGYRVTQNTLTGSVGGGFQAVVLLTGWGNNNVFDLNAVSNVPGYGFSIGGSTTGNKVKCNNTVTGAGSGFANVTCTQ